jgi:hypothetical protein
VVFIAANIAKIKDPDLIYLPVPNVRSRPLIIYSDVSAMMSCLRRRMSSKILVSTN